MNVGSGAVSVSVSDQCLLTWGTSSKWIGVCLLFIFPPNLGSLCVDFGRREKS